MWLRDKYHSQRFSPWLTDLVIALLIFLFTYGLTIYRIEQAPDIFTDEIVYTRAGIRTAGEGALVWDSGEAFLVHPPLYFIVEGIYFTITGEPQKSLYAAGNIFASVFNARHINAFFGGLTAVILYFFGKRLHSERLGLLLALIFSLDPFILRINRRAMLETMAGMLVLTGMLLYFIHSKPILNPKWKNSGWHIVQILVPKPGLIIAGLVFGLALLTKELVFFSLIAVIIFSILEFLSITTATRQEPESSPIITNLIWTIYPALIVITIAGLTYLLYPLWALYSGDWSVLWHEKTLGFQRLLGLVQLTGWNRPGISLFDLLLQRLADYGSSYLLIALGGIATLVLFLWARHIRPARFLIAWGLTLYPFFAFLAIKGSGNDHFFYYLIVPAIILVGYTVILISKLKKASLPFKQLTQFAERLPIPRETLAPLLLLLVIMPYSIYHWWENYAVGYDNGYTQFTQFVNIKLPPQWPLNASGDPVKFHYFFPDRPIFNVVTPEEAIKAGVHIIAIAPKDFRYRYYWNANPQFEAWVQQHGNLIYQVTGDSYGDIYLYYVGFPDQKSPVVQPDNSGGSHWRSYQVARSGFVGTFIISLFIWLLFWGFLIILIYGLQRIRRSDLPFLQRWPENMKFSPISFIKSWFT